VPRLLSPVLPTGTFADREQAPLSVDGGLTLRRWERTDAVALAAAYQDRAIQHWHHRSMDVAEAERWIGEAHHAWSVESDAEWAVAGAGDRVVGRVALRGVSLDVAQAEVSYWTVPAARRRRVASRAVARLAHWALEEVGFWRLVVRHSTDNLGSCRVADAAGFHHEARLRRAHLHADGWHDIHVHTRFRATPEG
jgi:[ribosomal protein S5]-alanine N-acetyltransferase